MKQEKYSLSWHSYSDHLKSMMKELMMNEDFSDVTLVTEDKKHLKANINILSACSPVFKDLLKKEKNSNTIMYLRGIQFSEMESILQFIYLGESTFYKERINEFLMVAKSLEINELCNADTESFVEDDETESTDNPENEPSATEQETFQENLKEEPVVSVHSEIQAPRETQRKVSRVNGKYECRQCNLTFEHVTALNHHNQKVHNCEKYACSQCDYQFTQKSVLTRHIQSKHEGVKYACDVCDYQATRPFSLTRHIKTKHDINRINFFGLGRKIR